MRLDTLRGNRLCGIYMGRVIAHIEGGKYKVFVPGVYKDLWKYNIDCLPTAVLANDVDSGGMEGNGIINFLNIGTVVYVMFANEDQNYPVIFATSIGDDDFKKIKNYSSFQELSLESSKILDRFSSAFDTNDDGFDYEFKHNQPETVHRKGKTLIKQTANGKIETVCYRNMMNEVDKPNYVYSHSMHMLNLMIDQGRVQENNYFVFTDNPEDIDNSKIHLKKIVNRRTDFQQNYYFDHLNDVDENDFVCIGISCVLDTPQDSEGYVATLDGFEDGIVNYPSWNKLMYNSWMTLPLTSTYRPYIRSKQMNCVFIKMEGSDKFVKFASDNGAGLYICNGLQYGMKPDYFDKKFADGNYSPYCDDTELPTAVLPDAQGYDIHVLVADPYLIKRTETICEDGSRHFTIYNQRDEYDYSELNNGSGIVQKREYNQEGGYGNCQRALTAFNLHNVTTDINSCSLEDKQRRYTQSDDESNEYIIAVSSDTVKNILSSSESQTVLSAVNLKTVSSNRYIFENDMIFPEEGALLKVNNYSKNQYLDQFYRDETISCQSFVPKNLKEYEKYKTQLIDSKLKADSQNGIHKENTESNIEYSSSDPIVQDSIHSSTDIHNGITDIKKYECLWSSPEKNTTHSDTLTVHAGTRYTEFKDAVTKNTAYRNVDVNVGTVEVNIENVGTFSKLTMESNGCTTLETTQQIVENAGNGSILTMQNNGHTDLWTSKEVIVDAASQIIFKIGGSEVMKITAGLVEITGNLKVSGNIDAEGDVTDMGCTLATHVHPYVVHSGITNKGVG